MKTPRLSKQLTSPTKYAFYSSTLLAAFACIFNLAVVLGLLVDGVHFALWITIAAWFLLAAGVAAKGV